MIIIYLLSNKDKWNIRVAQLYKEFKDHIGRDALYNIINEAIEAGYMKREIYKEKGFKRYRYFLSEKPKFKKSLLYPENPYTEIPDAENQGSKELISEGEISKGNIIATPEPEPPKIEPPKKKAMPAGGNNNFYKCLDKCEDLSPKQKSQLSKYPEHIVEQAVKYTYHPATKLKGPQAHIKQLHAFCKDPDSYADTMKELDSPHRGKSPKDQIISTFKKGERYNGYEFSYNDKGPYFISPNGIRTYGIEWKEAKDKWNDLLKHLKIE
jgi:hypothetical protein